MFLFSFPYLKICTSCPYIRTNFAVTTNYHKFDDSKQQKFIILSSGLRGIKPVGRAINFQGRLQVVAFPSFQMLLAFPAHGPFLQVQSQQSGICKSLSLVHLSPFSHRLQEVWKKDSDLICSSFCNKNTISWGTWTTNVDFSQFGRLAGPRSRYQKTQCLAKVHVLVHLCLSSPCNLTC